MRSKNASSLMLALTVLGGTSMIAVGSVDINWSVLASGGGRVTAGTYTLDNTAGQAIVGLASNGPSGLCAGFWCAEEAKHPVYLPLLRLSQ